MTPRILPGGVQAALAYYAERLGTPDEVTPAAAARLHDVKRQTLHAALKRQGGTGVPGRKTRAGRASGKLTVRRTEEELAAWTEEADKRGVHVSEWVRDVANEAVKRRRSLVRCPSG